MKSQTSHSDQSLQDLFKRLPEEKIPENLNSDIMIHIQHMHSVRQQWTHWLTWCSVSIASMGMLFLAIKTFNYLDINIIDFFQNLFSRPQIQLHEEISYLIIGGIALLLLFLDFRIRKLLLK